ncbi:MAG: hypothetical protein Kow0069_09530 [Promethearchaeota archaeon]
MKLAINVFIFRRMTRRRSFKRLFKNERSVPLAVALEAAGVNSPEALASALSNWKIEEYYEVVGDAVVRTSSPTRWEVVKHQLRRLGKLALVRGLPAAIGALAGGVGLTIALGPVVGEIVGRLKRRGLEVPEDAEATLLEALSGGTGEALESLVKRLVVAHVGLGFPRNKAERAVRTALNEEVRPVFLEIQAALGALKGQQEHLADIFEDWADEQRAALESGRAEMSVGFARSFEQLRRLEEAIAPSLANLREEVAQVGDDVRRGFSKVQRQLDALLEAAHVRSFGGKGTDEIETACRLQMDGVRLAGKFDRPFERAEFVPTSELDEDFRTFVWESESQPLFLLVARVGLGKTWNAVHLARLAMKEGAAFSTFFPLQYGFREQLRGFFPEQSGNLVEDVAEQCKAVHSEHSRPFLLVFDGLDEIRFSNDTAGDFLAFLSRLLDRCGGSVRVLLTDRLEDWATTGGTTNLTPHVCVNPASEEFRRRARLPTPISYHLAGFTRDQLKIALWNHGLTEGDLPPGLLELCRQPYVLQIVAERGFFPDPANGKEFLPLFYDPDPAVRTILKRLDLSDDEGLAVLWELAKTFEEVGGLDSAVPYARIRKLAGKYPSKWRTILLGGLLNFQGAGLSKVFSLAPHYKAALGELVRLVGPGNVGRKAEVDAARVVSQPTPTRATQAASEGEPLTGQKWAVRALDLSPAELERALQGATPEQRAELVELAFGSFEPRPLRLLRIVAELVPHETVKFFSSTSKRAKVMGALIKSPLEGIEEPVRSRLEALRSAGWQGPVYGLAQLIHEALRLPKALSLQLAETVVLPELEFLEGAGEPEARATSTVDAGASVGGLEEEPSEYSSPAVVGGGGGGAVGGWRWDSNALSTGVKILASRLGKGPESESAPEPEPEPVLEHELEPELEHEPETGSRAFFEMGVRLLERLGFGRPSQTFLGEERELEPTPGPESLQGELGPDFFEMGVRLMEQLGIGERRWDEDEEEDEDQ